MSKRFTISRIFASATMAALLWCQVEYHAPDHANGAADPDTFLAQEIADEPGHAPGSHPAAHRGPDQLPKFDCDFSVALQSDRLISIPLTVGNSVQAAISSINNLISIRPTAALIAATIEHLPPLFRTPVDRRVLIRV